MYCMSLSSPCLHISSLFFAFLFWPGINSDRETRRRYIVKESGRCDRNVDLKNKPPATCLGCWEIVYRGNQRQIILRLRKLVRLRPRGSITRYFKNIDIYFLTGEVAIRGKGRKRKCLSFWEIFAFLSRFTWEDSFNYRRLITSSRQTLCKKSLLLKGQFTAN